MQVTGNSKWIGMFCLGAMAGCSGAVDRPELGTVSIEVRGSAASGAVYRLRDAEITVQGPVGTVFHTEDGPDRSRLSAEVVAGQYSALLQEGWRLERVDGATSRTVAATLLSENPVAFSVQPRQRTSVPLRFQVTDGAADPRSGYDVVLEIEEVEPQPPHPDMLVAIRDATGHLERIDLSTGAISDIGSLGVAYFGGDCAWNPADAALYVVDGRGGRELYRVSLATGKAKLVGVHDVNFMQALAYHPPTKRLYGVSTTFAGSSLYALSTTTGAATRVGNTGGNIEGLVWDSARQRMLTVEAGRDDVDTLGTAGDVDISTGSGSALASLPFLGKDSGMTYDPHANRIWITGGGSLNEYDPAQFVRTGDFLVDVVPIRELSIGTHTCVAFVPATL